MPAKKNDHHHQTRQPHRRIGEVTKRNVETVSRIEAQLRGERTPADRVIDAISAFCGSSAFIWIHCCWYGARVLINLFAPAQLHFDKYPFNFLTLVVSLEAIFLSTFILISQNRQGHIAELRSHLDLQIDLLGEQESTKILLMLERIERKLGIQEADAELEQLERQVEPEDLVSQIEHIIEGLHERQKR